MRSGTQLYYRRFSETNQHKSGCSLPEFFPGRLFLFWQPPLKRRLNAKSAGFCGAVHAVFFAPNLPELLEICGKTE
jgi:hypothetical protein